MWSKLKNVGSEVGGAARRVKGRVCAAAVMALALGAGSASAAEGEIVVPQIIDIAKLVTAIQTLITANYGLIIGLAVAVAALGVFVLMGLRAMRGKV